MAGDYNEGMQTDTASNPLSFDSKRFVAGYQVIDTVTGCVVKSYTADQRKAAYRMADKRSLAYGSYRYTVGYLWSAD